MKAITYSSTGGSDVLVLGEREEPHAGPGEVRVRIHVSAVNPTDWKARAGSGKTELPRPQVPNQDGAGVVDEVGDGVTGLAVGDRVWVWDAAYQRPDGTAQELVVLPEAQAVPLPESASFDVGASLGIPALTAHRALTAYEYAPAELAPGSLEGRTVLVAGGAGAVGHAAIQLAAWAGATVIATVSSHEKAELARAAGAHHVVDYTDGDTAQAIGALAPRGVDIVVEVNVIANAELDAKVCGTNATISVYADAPGRTEVTLPVRPSMSKNLRWQFLLTYTTTPETKAAAVRSVAAAVAAGALPVGEEHGLPLTRFPLERTADAHDAVESGIVGKVLIDVA
ncbi:NADPH:quinone reductase [Leifsonia sp. F6_8S_P_1B]|uniref:NADPH:quinone reductase n=1 Tax=Leifsonia williamsii TaxID=3035919 RepID=A0ABT8K948_9MICO|nr:NADPH:quinone reductase [Leifsonia williamsii]MDN4613567.1 NADPH:quinone reductase [Leifsonia williamsii]